MKEVTATIVYPVEVAISVSEETSKDAIWEALLAASDKSISTSVSPVIYKCSEKELMAHQYEEAPSPETQAEWVDIGVKSMLEANKYLATFLVAKSFFNKDISDKVSTISKELAELNKQISENMSARQFIS